MIPKMNSISRPTHTQIIYEPVEENQKSILTLSDRISRFALLVFLVILIVPIFFERPYIKKLWLETYDGIDRSSSYTNEIIDTDLETIVKRDNIDKLSRLNSVFNLIFRDEIATFHNKIREECTSLSFEIKDLKSQMRRFDNFIKKHKELFEVCLFYLQQFPEFISLPPEIPSTLDPENPIDLRTMLLMEKNNLEHLIQQKKEFFMRHQEVYDVFLKYLKEMPEEIEYI